MPPSFDRPPQLRATAAGSIVVFALLTVACDDAGSADSGARGIDVNARQAFDQLPGCPHEGELVVDCSLAFDDQPTYTVRVSDAGATTEEHGGLKISLDLFQDGYEGSSFDISIHTADQSVSSMLYQFQECGPVNQFHGYHGFTGLISADHPTNADVGVQLACFVRSPSDPIRGWDSEGI